MIASLPEQQRTAILSKFTEDDFAELEADWRFWARPEQIAPQGKWSTWLALAGRGWGKTEAGAQWIKEREADGARQIALIAETQKDLEEVMVPRLLGLYPNNERPIATTRPVRIKWPSGAFAFGYVGNEPEQLRGPEFDTAWCFIAGTLVETPEGRRRIETLRDGDTVLTRYGPQRVAACGSRRRLVGRVQFSNGAVLIGTGDHPVYTSRGWTSMSELAEGDTVCAISASNGAGERGIATGVITSEPSRAQTDGATSTFTERCTLRTMGRFLRGTTSTIATAIQSITRLRIWRLSRDLSTASGMTCPVAIGARCHLWKWNAQTAGALSGAKSVWQRSFADRANPNEPRQRGKPSGVVANAGRTSNRAPETFAASVASTWRPVGQREVFCLTVESAPEYFANGILVHNCDELAKYKRTKTRDYAQETWDMLQFTMRRPDPRVLVTTTPRPIPIIQALAKDPTTQISTGSTYENAANLAPQFLEAIRKRYEGTRLGRQELRAEILNDVPGALWHRDWIKVDEIPTDLRRVVVAVDPSGTAGADEDGEQGDDIGIVVAGQGIDGLFYVLEDATCQLSPAQWGRRVVQAYGAHAADMIVAERNFGGAMVEMVIRSADRNANVKMVTASRGKAIRAEPIAALYEQGRVIHEVGMDELEDEMLQMTAHGFVGRGSPNRTDALVWALTELALEQTSSIRVSVA